MTRRLLIGGHLQQEMRVAIVQDSTLEEYQFEVAEGGMTRGNIYRGTIASIEPSLNCAVLTTNLSLPGRSLVLMPFDDSRGVSRKVEDEAERKVLKEVAASLVLPEGCLQCPAGHYSADLFPIFC